MIPAAAARLFISRQYHDLMSMAPACIWHPALRFCRLRCTCANFKMDPCSILQRHGHSRTNQQRGLCRDWLVQYHYTLHGYGVSLAERVLPRHLPRPKHRQRPLRPVQSDVVVRCYCTQPPTVAPYILPDIVLGTAQRLTSTL